MLWPGIPDRPSSLPPPPWLPASPIPRLRRSSTAAAFSEPPPPPGPRREWRPEEAGGLGFFDPRAEREGPPAMATDLPMSPELEQIDGEIHDIFRALQ